MRNRNRSGPAGTRMMIACALLILATAAWTGLASAQVLGACGTKAENEPAVSPPPTAGASSGAPAPAALHVSGIPLPGDKALNFELPAVIGDEIEMVKLSDFNGKWRVVCFYPADFTFV